MMSTRFADFMKRLRTEAHLSFDDAARRLGVGVKDLAAWENGQSLPSELSVSRISQVYGIPEKEWLDVLLREKG